MKNAGMLECLEQNSEGLEKIQFFMKYAEELTYSDLMMEISIDHFEGYEALLPIMLLSTDDPVIERACKRLFLQLCSEKLQEIGGKQIVDHVADILKDEKRRWDQRIEKLRGLDRQNEG